MKYILLTLLALAPVSTRAEAIFNHPKIGWYSAFHAKASKINGDSELLLGGESGKLANGQWGVGVAVNFDFQRHQIAHTNPDSVGRLHFSYGGVTFTFTPQPYQVVHFSSTILIGAAAVITGHKEQHRDFLGNVTEEWKYKTDPAFIFEPQIGGELNILDNYRVGLGVSYRLAAGFPTRMGVKSSDLSGAAAVFSIKYGGL